MMKLAESPVRGYRIEH